MKLCLLLSLGCCLVAGMLATQGGPDLIDISEQETRRERFRRPGRVFEPTPMKQSMSSRYDFRNRKPDEIEVLPCPPEIRCVHGTCGSVMLRWGEHVENYPNACQCDEAYTGHACDIPVKKEDFQIPENVNIV